MKESELKKKILEYQILQSRLEALSKQRELILQKIAEATSALRTISNIKKDSEIVFSLGFNSYSMAKVLSDKFLVEIGSNVLVEKNKEDALNFLSGRKSELEKSLLDIEKEMVSISKKIQTIADEISKSDKNVQLS